MALTIFLLLVMKNRNKKKIEVEKEVGVRRRDQVGLTPEEEEAERLKEEDEAN
jgi:hypothetical protein